MKMAPEFYHLRSNFINSVLVIFVLLSLQSCARKITFDNSPYAPAAHGFVKIKKDNNDNYGLNLKVKNLAPSDRLTPPRRTYVVWIDTDRSGVKNVGRINSSSGLFSSKLKSSLKTVTSFKPIRVFVTAEDDSNVSYPGLQEVLRTRTF